MRCTIRAHTPGPSRPSNMRASSITTGPSRSTTSPVRIQCWNNASWRLSGSREPSTKGTKQTATSTQIETSITCDPILASNDSYAWPGMKRGIDVMETLIKDIRYGLRSLLKRPGFTAVALIALALGIGANTAIFSLVNAVLLQPLPFAEPDRLVWMWGNIRNATNRASVAPLDYLDYRAQNTTFEEFAGMLS